MKTLVPLCCGIAGLASLGRAGIVQTPSHPTVAIGTTEYRNRSNVVVALAEWTVETANGRRPGDIGQMRVTLDIRNSTGACTLSGVGVGVWLTTGAGSPMGMAAMRVSEIYSVAPGETRRITSSYQTELMPDRIFAVGLSAPRDFVTPTMPGGLQDTFLTFSGSSLCFNDFKVTGGGGGNRPAIDAVKGVQNAANYRPGLTAGSFFSVFGSNLAPTTRTWQDSDLPGGALPTALDGAGVRVNGVPCYIFYISPVQINAIAPITIPSGRVNVTVVNANGSSDTFVAQSDPLAPAIFNFYERGGGYAIGVDLQGGYIGPAGLIAGVDTRPARPGEYIQFFATGLGPTNPAFPDGRVLPNDYPISNTASVTIGGRPALVQYAGLIAPGLYQINLRVPTDVVNGEQNVVLTVAGKSSPTPHVIPITGGAPPPPPPPPPTEARSFLFAANVSYNSEVASVSAYAISRASGALTQAPGSPFRSGRNSAWVAADPSGRFLYVANDLSSDVSAFTIDAVSGALRAVPGSPFATGVNPRSLAIHPSGIFVYAANYGSNTVSGFAVNQSTGALSPLSGSPFPAGTNPQGIVLSASGDYAYVVNRGSNSVSRFSVNPSIGALVNREDYGTGAEPFAIAVDPLGRYAFVANMSANTVTRFNVVFRTGALTRAGADVPVGGRPMSVACSPNGNHLYVVNFDSGTVSAFQINGGALTEIAGSPFRTGPAPQSIAIDPSGSFAYVANGASNDISAFTIDPSTGALRGGSRYAAGFDPFSLAIATRR